MPNNYIEIGSSGLRRYSGFITEEWLRQLDGPRGTKMYREMADNDGLIGGILFTVEMLLRNVRWRVQPFDDSPASLEQAEFVESLMDDMSHTWGDFIAESLSMLIYGFAPMEIVYKRRVGPTESDPTRRSRHSDGRIGWRKLPLRSQDSLDRWEFDDDGGIRGMWQDPINGGSPVLIPIEKMLLFRTTSRKNSPEGRSALRNAYVSYYHKKKITEMEATGVNRDLTGMPVFWLPPSLFDPNATASEKAQLAEYRHIMENIRADSQGGLLLPLLLDANGKKLLHFELAGTGTRRQHDTSAIINRHDQQMAISFLADFIMLGHEGVGSFALSSDKTAMFATALGAWLGSLADTVNRHGLPRLYELNGWDSAQTATLIPGDLEKPDIEKLTNAVATLTSAGFLTPGAVQDENHLRETLDMPALDESAAEEDRATPAETE